MRATSRRCAKPHAATLCDQCGVVCPVRIPLPELLRTLHEKQVELKLRPWRERLALRTWGWLAARPVVYGWAARLGVRYLGWLARDTDRIRVLGLAPGWSNGRDLPAPQGRRFRERYAARKKKEKRA